MESQRVGPDGMTEHTHTHTHTHVLIYIYVIFLDVFAKHRAFLKIIE